MGKGREDWEGGERKRRHTVVDFGDEKLNAPTPKSRKC